LIETEGHGYSKIMGRLVSARKGMSGQSGGSSLWYDVSATSDHVAYNYHLLVSRNERKSRHNLPSF
jgi:hypothetical protein